MISSHNEKKKQPCSSWFPLLLTEYNLSYLGYIAVMATLSLYFVSGLHLAATLAGALMLFTSLSFRFSRAFLAPLIDRFPAHRVAFVSLLVASLGYVGLSLTKSLLFVIPLFFFIGLGHGINSMLVKTLTAYTTVDKQHSPFLRYAYLAAGVNLMTALGSVLGSTLVLFLSFQSVFFFASLFYGLSAGITLFLPSFPAETVQRPAWFTALRLNLKRPSLRRAMISTFLGWFLYTQYYASLPLFVGEGLHHQDLLSTLFVLNTILICIQLPLSRMLFRFRLPTSQGVLLAFLSFSTGYVLLWLFPFWQMVYLAVVFWTLGEMLLIPALDTQVAEGALLHQRQVAFTLNSMIIGCGEGLGNFAGVSIMSRLLRSGEIQNFYLIFFLLALGAIGILILSGDPRESLIMRKFRGLPWIPTGQTDALPPLFSATPKGKIIHTVLRRLKASYIKGDRV